MEADNLKFLIFNSELKFLQEMELAPPEFVQMERKFLDVQINLRVKLVRKHQEMN